MDLTTLCQNADHNIIYKNPLYVSNVQRILLFTFGIVRNYNVGLYLLFGF